MLPKFGHLRKLLELSVPIFRKGILVKDDISVSTVYFSSHSSNHSIKNVNKKPDWNRAILEAEKVVGYPNVFISLQSLPSDDILSIVGELRKLVGTSHPLLKITKRMIYNGRNNMQTRGLIVLLAAKTAGRPQRVTYLPNAEEGDSSILKSQRDLAQITEMIHTAHLIHKAVVNLKGLTLEDKTTLRDLEFGNKIAVLVGDYLLTNASLLLDKLKNTMVVEIMALAIRNFVEGEFVFEQDVHGTTYPVQSSTIRDWEVRTYLGSASLLSNSCQSAMLLANHKESVQIQAFELGKQLGFTWQAFLDLQPFTDRALHPPGTAFDLASLPLILQLQKDPSILELILPHYENLEAVDYEKIRSIVNSGTAVSEAKQLCKKYAEETIEILHQFPPSEARQALQNILAAMD